mmetsp:Transcript_1011/g.2302  ORF Transcript_1011/g.2302 Transcript_1011/m.2302 type:complete len:105 (-) Transcript_1011:498-812(-)
MVHPQGVQPKDGKKRRCSVTRAVPFSTKQLINCERSTTEFFDQSTLENLSSFSLCRNNVIRDAAFGRSRSDCPEPFDKMKNYDESLTTWNRRLEDCYFFARVFQ